MSSHFSGTAHYVKIGPTIFFYFSWYSFYVPVTVHPDQRMYPPSRKDFISLTLSDPHNHSYNNGKQRRQSCWRVSGPGCRSLDCPVLPVYYGILPPGLIGYNPFLVLYYNIFKIKLVSNASLKKRR